MNLFRNKYRTRIEDKIIQLEIKRAYLKGEEEKLTSETFVKDRVHFIVLRKETEKDIELLNELLKPDK